MFVFGMGDDSLVYCQQCIIGKIIVAIQNDAVVPRCRPYGSISCGVGSFVFCKRNVLNVIIASCIPLTYFIRKVFASVIDNDMLDTPFDIF